MGFIAADELRSLAQSLADTAYGQYLLHILEARVL
jgi:hypothetical protein